jgi:hypothetical protein
LSNTTLKQKQLLCNKKQVWKEQLYLEPINFIVVDAFVLSKRGIVDIMSCLAGKNNSYDGLKSFYTNLWPMQYSLWLCN